MGRHLIVDGYNVIKQDASLKRLEATSLEQARETLILRLGNAYPLRHDRITVVFDGWDSGNPRETRERRGKVTIVYSKQDERADEVIKRLAAEAPQGGEVLVVTNDAEIRRSVALAGQEATRVPTRIYRPRPNYDGRLHKEDDDSGPRRDTKKGNPRQGKKRSPRPPVLW